MIDGILDGKDAIWSLVRSRSSVFNLVNWRVGLLLRLSTSVINYFQSYVLAGERFFCNGN